MLAVVILFANPNPKSGQFLKPHGIFTPEKPVFSGVTRKGWDVIQGYFAEVADKVIFFRNRKDGTLQPLKG